MTKPKEENTMELYAWQLRHNFNYNPTALTNAITKGLNLGTLRSYLGCLKNHKDRREFSDLLLEHHGFNTISIWIAYKTRFNVIDKLLEYIDCLEAEMIKHAPEFPA